MDIKKIDDKLMVIHTKQKSNGVLNSDLMEKNKIKNRRRNIIRDRLEEGKNHLNPEYFWGGIISA